MLQKFHVLQYNVILFCQEQNAELKTQIVELTKQTRARGSITQGDGKLFQELAKYQEENEELKRGILEYSEKWRAKSKLWSLSLELIFISK